MKWDWMKREVGLVEIVIAIAVINIIVILVV